MALREHTDVIPDDDMLAGCRRLDERLPLSIHQGRRGQQKMAFATSQIGLLAGVVKLLPSHGCDIVLSQDLEVRDLISCKAASCIGAPSKNSQALGASLRGIVHRGAESWISSLTSWKKLWRNAAQLLELQNA
eukprot:345601-Amphidinium_carterae.2